MATVTFGLLLPPVSRLFNAARVETHQKVVVPGASLTPTTSPRVTFLAPRVSVGAGGRSEKPLYSRTALPAPTGFWVTRSTIASAQPMRPELYWIRVGGHDAFGSGACEVGTT